MKELLISFLIISGSGITGCMEESHGSTDADLQASVDKTYQHELCGICKQRGCLDIVWPHSSGSGAHPWCFKLIQRSRIYTAREYRNGNPDTHKKAVIAIETEIQKAGFPTLKEYADVLGKEKLLELFDTQAIKVFEQTR